MTYGDNTLVVVYFVSNLFAEQCGVSIASLFESNSDFESIEVYIIEDGISDENKKRLNILAENYQRNIITIPMPNPQSYYRDERFTIKTLGHTFARMIVGDLLPDEISKVICIDSDMLVLQSLKELWCIDMQDNYLAGVDSAPGIAMMKKSLQIEPGTLYCNGGFFLVNLSAVRADHLEYKYKEYISQVFDKGCLLTAYEEETMNKCAYPRVIRLHPKYNLMTVNLVMDYDSFVKFRNPVNFYTREEMQEACDSPVIVHAINTFYVRKRIWEKNSDSPYADVYVEYRKKTPWKDTPQIVVHRSIKQTMMKQVWHIMPPKMAFAFAAWVRNVIRPMLSKKRDDE